MSEEELQYCGLHNFGSTCYINSILQCLNVTPSILKGITNIEEHKKDLELYEVIQSCSEEEIKTNDFLRENNINIEKIKKMNIYFNFKKLIIELNKNKNRTINPLNFILSCKIVAEESGFDHLFSGMQNDVQELFTFLIDNLHESKTNTNEIQTKFNSLEDCGNSNSDKIYYEAEKKFKEFYNKKSSWLIDEFYFQVICITKCNKCPYYSLTYDPSNILILPIPKINNNKSLTLTDCLDHHFGREVLKGDASWKCDKCSNKDCNFKQYRLFNTPKTLAISLKRFEYSPKYMRFIKNKTLVEVPNILNMSNYKLFNKFKNIQYKLYGIVNHIGNLEGGHYYSYCRNDIKTHIKEGNDEWLEYNDETISKVNGNVITPNIYMLFYQLVESE